MLAQQRPSWEPATGVGAVRQGSRKVSKGVAAKLDEHLPMHVWERFSIHFFSSAGGCLLALWGFWTPERKARWWPQLQGWRELILPAAVSFLRISL